MPLDDPDHHDMPDLMLGRFDFGRPRNVTAPSVAEARLAAWLIARSGARGFASDVSDAGIDWKATIARAARDHALPMLATVIDEAGLKARVPADVATYLDYALAANAKRNADIRLEAIAIGRALDRIGVTGVLLKGAAITFDDGPGCADRMMRDIDILVPADRLDDVEAALAREGFRPSPIALIEEGHIHGAPLEHPDHPALLEVHVEVSTRPWLLPAAQIFARCVPVAPGLARPSLEDRILHNVIHGQIANGNFSGGVLNMSDATDIGRFVAAGFDACDWDGLARAADDGGIRAPLAAALHQAAYVTGCPVPAPFDAAPRRHLRRTLLQRRWPLLDRMLRPLRYLSRGLAWERDSYALRLGGRRDWNAHVQVNRRRLGRGWARLERLLKR